ncbi:hypothetical protein M0R45_031264 [Rubus argutus]|uniref:Alpha,alpha-trehalose-phosphate synthase [UDP-forming] 7 n=1 Tax=Rubus argutus TaxID=59490 RepID=A0AAW1WFC7_RUBAR
MHTLQSFHFATAHASDVKPAPISHSLLLFPPRVASSAGSLAVNPGQHSTSAPDYSPQPEAFDALRISGTSLQWRGEGKLPRVSTAPGNLSDLDDDQTRSVSSDQPSSITSDRVIIVANQLPLKAKRREDNTGWNFSWNEDSLLLQLKDGLPDDMEVLYVGSLRVHVDPIDQEDVSHVLLDEFKCVPTFLPPDILAKFYDGFCKKHLWPLFHYMMPFSAEQGGRFDRSLWEAYISANKLFFQRVVELINPDEDYIWIHDYHLMVLPTFLRRRFSRVRMGFFFTAHFPHLRSIELFLRMLGLVYQSKRGYLGLEYYGRTIRIKIMPVGVHMGWIESVMKVADEDCTMRELKQKFEGKTMLLGVDDMDIFKGISLKLLAMEQMLKQHPNWQGKAVLVQIVNPARGKGIDLKEIQEEIQENCRRINEEFGKPGYEPIIIIDKPVSISERVSYYRIAECVVVTAVRDGMNLIPYEYVVCRQGYLVPNHVQTLMAQRRAC